MYPEHSDRAVDSPNERVPVSEIAPEETVVNAFYARGRALGMSDAELYPDAPDDPRSENDRTPTS
jgi:hypothetical protein